MTDELSPEREERLIVEMLRERGAIDPGSGPPASGRAAGAHAGGAGTQLWVSRCSGAGNGGDGAASVAVSPGGAKVFVTGSGYSGKAAGEDYVTVACSAATGARLWARRCNGPAKLGDAAAGVVVARDGSTVFVTGTSWAHEFPAKAGYGDDWATVAYRASTGAQLWARRYNGPARSGDTASSVAVARDGTKVFVTGYSNGGTTTRYDYATVACNAATGAQPWARRYNGPGNSYDMAASLAVNPSGTRVFVTGASEASRYNTDYGTIAYQS